ncbi:hypothetical protein [Clostridium beijerinckii]|uniref:hypothetical protein n=1 Tax=Clostridium beijerinckii TaxID=1520 RepID=UPI001F4C2483|nr:hypothetical protein [Clostridium beijerinckii]NRT72954.1 hypothetical protein [Clostridium beijerinckii]
MEICKKINQKYLNENPSKNSISIDYNGIKIEYTSNQYKAVPEGYKPTEEEKNWKVKEFFKLDMEVKKQKLVKISQLHGMKMEYLIAS